MSSCHAGDVSNVTAQVPHPVAKTAVAVRAALPEPTRVEFDQRWRAALTAAADSFDLSEAQAVIEEFWPRAVLAANPDLVSDYIKTRLDAGDWSVVHASRDELVTRMRPVA
jgi:Family of unknown function (DUF6247)